jgi:hypothetical protein
MAFDAVEHFRSGTYVRFSRSWLGVAHETRRVLTYEQVVLGADETLRVCFEARLRLEPTGVWRARLALALAGVWAYTWGCSALALTQENQAVTRPYVTGHNGHG